MSDLTGGELAAECLRRMGTRFVFGVPGGQTLAVTDALYDCHDIRFVTTRHELAAAHAADGYARITGRPGVCLATAGPGVTNLLTGVAGAFKDSTPLVALGVNNRSGDLGKDDTQAADHTAIFQTLTKATLLATRPADIPPALASAYQVARTGCPGPVLVDLTRDAVEDRTQTPDVWPEFLTDVPRPAPSASEVESAVELLSSSERPAIWCGKGVTLSQAGSLVLNLAQRLQAPVVTTYNGIGSVPTEHPLVFGCRSRMGTTLGNRVLREADCVLAVGNSLNAVSTSRWALRLPSRLIHADIDPAVIGRYYEPQVGLVGDATVTLQMLLKTLGGFGRVAERPWLATLDKARREWWAAIAADLTSARHAITPQYAVRTLSAVLPEDAVLAADAGNPGLWAFLFDVGSGRAFMKPVGFGNMGFSLPAAIAASLANPTRRACALIGDGSLGMCLAELETTIREGTPVLVVVLNDHGYGNIRQEQQIKYGTRSIGVDFHDLDYAAIARCFGLGAIRVERPAELPSALQAALQHPGPFLVDVVIDPTVNVWSYPHFAEADA